MSALIIAPSNAAADLTAYRLGIDDWYSPVEPTGDVHAHVPGVETIVYVEGWERSRLTADVVAIAVEAARQHGADLELEHEWAPDPLRARAAAKLLANERKRFTVTGVPPEAFNAPAGLTRPRSWWRRLLGIR